MMWNIKYYQEGNRKPVKEFIDSQPQKVKAKILRNMALLSEFGVSMGRPLIDKVEGNIYELRTIFQGNQYRILFSIIDGQVLLLTVGFKKKTQKILDSDKHLAQRRLQNYLEKGDS